MFEPPAGACSGCGWLRSLDTQGLKMQGKRTIRTVYGFTLLASLLWSVSGANAQAGPTTIAAKTAGLTRLDGYVTLYLDPKGDKTYLQVDKLDQQLLYEQQLSDGIGEYGLDRGAVYHPNLVHFHREGSRVLLIAENTAWRTSSTVPEAADAAKRSFAESAIGTFPIVAEENGTLLVDSTEFFLRDSFGAAERLTAAKEGTFRLDATRSAIYRERTKAFPKNTEVESMLTFVNPEARRRPIFDGDGQRQGLAAVAPDPRYVTIHVHQSFVELPPLGFHPREFDPRAGYFNSVIYFDWNKPLDQPLDTHLMLRHRLEKKNPGAAVSDPVQPIVYYVDRGIPEPIRSAIVEGAGWWNQAFEAAGFHNAFQVKLLPGGADPMDIRYNMILWVERSVRAFSNGAEVIDPRTGEILKAEVSLTSGRERELFLMTEALLSPYKNGNKPDPAQEKMVLARMRQLAAHEVGHTLGLGHNHAASNFGQGGSVEDYPFPDVQLDAKGNIDLSKAYQPGIGEWDKVSIRFGYTEFPKTTTPEQEKAGLNKILSDAYKNGMYFITTQDAGSIASIHPYATQWDNGKDAADELTRILKVREVALNRFSEAAIQSGQPWSQLEDTYVLAYLFHRFQVENAAKVIAGQDFRYSLRGDGEMVTAFVTPEAQKKALAAVLSTLDVKTLTVPETLLANFPPRPPEYGRSQESFMGYDGAAFDAMAPVRAAAQVTLDALLEPNRVSRLVDFHARNAANPSLSDVVRATLQATVYAPVLTGLQGETQMAVNEAVLSHLLADASSASVSPLAREILRRELATAREWLTQHTPANTEPEQQAAYSAWINRINAADRAPAERQDTRPLQERVPEGAPI